MTAILPGYFSSPIALAVASVLLLVCVAIGLVRKPAMGRRPSALLGLGALMIALAAGEPIITRRSIGSVTVMVDLSPSTRGATFRDRAALDARIHQLLGDRPYRLVAFADSIQPLASVPQLADLAADHTVFTPPPADAIVLFSDGQFDLPATGPPTYPVIDPALEETGDAAVTKLDGSGSSLVANIRNDGGARSLRWTNATPLTSDAPTGSFQQYAKPNGSVEITAALSPGDRWPENDSLSIMPAPERTMQRWWVGSGEPAGWQQVDAAALPTAASDYLRTSAIVLRNIAADSLSSEQQRRLAQYVRDLGGSLIIVGGDHAFAAGGYDGAPLDSLSPLASSPPEPTTHWMLLVDGSGSMAGDGGPGASPWQIESSAVAALVPRLPQNDAVSVGSFAESLSWWTTGNSAKETALLHLPPASAFPHGPTNLAPVLRQIIAADDGAMVTQLLVLTDADTELANPEQIGAQMAGKKIHLHVLATGHGSALPALQRIAALTAGSVVEQLDPREWVAAAQVLLRQSLPDRYVHEPVNAGFTDPPLGAKSVNEWNRTWLRADAVPGAKSGDIPLAANWGHGLGRVAAVAYPADTATILALAAPIESPPRDPRFSVNWENGRSLQITVNAIDGQEYLNNLPIRVELCDADDVGGAVDSQPMPQVGPGLYEISVPAPRRPRIATVFSGPHTLERFALAGRYATEFDRIGNDLAALQELARRTGGKVVPPGWTSPIDFRWPARSTPIAPELALAGFIAIAAAMVVQRRMS